MGNIVKILLLTLVNICIISVFVIAFVRFQREERNEEFDFPIHVEKTEAARRENFKVKEEEQQAAPENAGHFDTAGSSKNFENIMDQITADTTPDKTEDNDL